jgi:hypothetical protein
MKALFKYYLCTVSLLIASQVQAASDFRYLHVSINTPWAIFIFLLIIILFPFILTAILYWYFAFKKNAEEKTQNETSAE